MRMVNEVLPGIYTALGVIVLVAQVAGRHLECIMCGGVFVVAIFVPLLSTSFYRRTKSLMARTLDSCRTEQEAVIMCIVHIWTVTKRGGRNDSARLLQFVEGHRDQCKDPSCPLTGEQDGEDGRLRRTGYLCWMLRKAIERFPFSVDLRLLEVVLLLDCAKDGLVAWVTIRGLLSSGRLSVIETTHLLKYKYQAE